MLGWPGRLLINNSSIIVALRIPWCLKSAAFPISSRPPLLVNLPAATVALIESQQTPPPLQLTDCLFMIAHNKIFLSRYEPPQWILRSRRSVRVHPVSGSWIPHNDRPPHRRNLAAKHDKRDHDASQPPSFPNARSRHGRDASWNLLQTSSRLGENDSAIFWCFTHTSVTSSKWTREGIKWKHCAAFSSAGA